MIDNSLGGAGAQKPGFFRQYFVTTHRLSKNPVSLAMMRKSS